MYHISPVFNGSEEKTQNDTYPICGICGEPHESSDCDIVRLKTTIIDTPVLSKARLSLPANLQLVSMADGSHSVITNELITKGTRFGPYEAKEQFSIPPTVIFPLKVFKNGDDDADDNYFKEYYLNTTNEYECNWMYFVNKANNLQEQNLISFQDNGQIFYISVRDIIEKEHLHVWYAPYYGKLMKMGSFLDAIEEVDPETLPVENIDINAIMKKQQNIRDRKTWICKFCGVHEDNIQAFALHITNHYISKMRKFCELCNARYTTTKSLKKHMFFVHNETLNEGKLQMAVEDKESTDVNSEPQLDPLLNEVPGENNVLLEHLNYQDSTSMGNEALTLNVDTILNEDENFNFEMPKEIGKESEKFVCDICLKQFGKLKLLVVHLNAHTGKFTCTQCLTVFVRKENFVAHKCLNNTSTEENKCSVCQKMFTLSKYLKRHMNRAHGQGFTCTKDCKKTFGSQKTLDAHSCDGTAASKSQQTVTCHLCSKEFGNNRNLTRHLKTHEKNTSSSPPVYICEICSKQFHNMKMMKQHLTSHKAPEFACKLCEKSFQRRSAFLEHMETHKNESPHECTKCSAKFTRKKYLTNHLLSHTDELKFVCTDCPQRFKHKVNLTKHYNISHAKTCKECAIDFETVNDYKQHMQTTHLQSTSQLAAAHLDKSYECPACKIRVKLRSSLKRHIKQKHTPDEYDFSTLDQYINEINKKEEPNESISQPEATTLSSTKPKVEVLSNIIVKAPNSSTIVSEEPKAGQSQEGLVQGNVQDTNHMQKMSSGAAGHVDSEMMHLLQANNAEVMQDLAGNLQLDEIVNVLGAKPPGPGENVLDYGSIEMEFENNFTTAVSKAAEMGITHTFDGASVCLSMPELTDANGQPVQLGSDNLQSSFILENASLNGPGEQVVLYILNQKPS